jgi:hypothetical protein
MRLKKRGAVASVITRRPNCMVPQLPKFSLQLGGARRRHTTSSTGRRMEFRADVILHEARLSSGKKIVAILWSILVIVQAILFERPQNLLVPGLCLFSGLSGTWWVLRRDRLLGHPVSSVMLLGYIGYYFLLPPIATILDAHPISFNLANPNLTVINAFLGLIAFLTAHALYCYFPAFGDFRDLVARRFYRPLGFFSVPSFTQLMLMGATGFAASAYLGILRGGYTTDGGGIFSKFVLTLIPFTFLPLVVTVPRMIGLRSSPSRGQYIVLALYVLAVFVLSLAWNSRTATFAGFASFLMVYLYGILIGQIYLKQLKLRHAIYLLFGFALVSGPFADLSQSITIVRGIRADVSPLVLIQKTLETFNDKNTLAEYRQTNDFVSSSWDESYADNVFLARLCNLKFLDNGIDAAMGMTAAQRGQMRQAEWDRLISFVPQPVLHAFRINVDKAEVISTSGGDATLLTTTGAADAVGGMRTGSLLGSAFAVFGWIYPFLLGIFAIPAFLLADVLARMVIAPGGGPYVILSPIVVISFYGTAAFLTSAASGADNIAVLLGSSLRGPLQTGIGYGLVFYLTRMFAALLSGFSRQA